MRDCAARRSESRANLGRAVQLLTHAATAKVVTEFTYAVLEDCTDLIKFSDAIMSTLMRQYFHAKCRPQAWRSWREYTSARRLLKVKGAAAAAALQHGAASRAWRTWLTHRDARCSKRQQV